ncbi:MAG: hypothetical protein K6F00_09875 [Lachnospiraceae bacterium]|nr:hypothetical protein [Lachnospiraceae bacterium]
MAIRIGNGVNISGMGVPTSTPGVNNKGDFSTDFHNLLTKEMTDINDSDKEKVQQSSGNPGSDEDWRKVLEDFDANEEVIMSAMQQTMAKQLKAEGMFDDDQTMKINNI